MINSERRKEYQRAYRRKNQQTLWSKHGARWGANRKEVRKQTRKDVLTHYGRVCACCGESAWEFLSIDHINGGGNKHRKTLKQTAGVNFYRWLQINGYPEGFRVLCHNCNAARGYYGYCPHEKPKQAQAILTEQAKEQKDE